MYLTFSRSGSPSSCFFALLWCSSYGFVVGFVVRSVLSCVFVIVSLYCHVSSCGFVLVSVVYYHGFIMVLVLCWGFVGVSRALASFLVGGPASHCVVP